MLESIGVKNLRGFGESSNIRIKPITILVGENSSGKSTFARIFPLFRQTIESETQGAVLWFGKYVDFGTHAIAKNRDSNSDYIEFVFNLKTTKMRIAPGLQFPEFTAEVKIALFDENGSSKIRELMIYINDEKLTFIATHKTEEVYNLKIISNDSDLPSNEINLSHQSSDSVLPTLNLDLDPAFFLHLVANKIDRPSIKRGYLEGTIQEAFEIVEKYKPSNPNETLDSFFEIFLTLDNIKSDRWRKKYNIFENDNNSNDIQKLESARRNLQLVYIIKSINLQLAETFKNTRYIGPVRAQSERYYRYQNLKTDEIDHLGSNLAMFLNSLSTEQQDNLELWMSANFGFEVAPRKDGSHYSIYIKQGNAEANISDMGFGFSQILPIIVSIWFESTKPSKREGIKRFLTGTQKELIFSIEQPELHLHPKLQYKFGEMLAKISSKKGRKYFRINFILETHSQHIIEAIGSAIECGIMDAKDVGIELFEKDSKGAATINTAEFDSEGYLSRWPIGFFSGK